MPISQPNSFIESIVALIFYLITFALIVYSMIALYTLNRFGRTRSITLGVSVIYVIVFGLLFIAGLVNLNSIKY